MFSAPIRRRTAGPSCWLPRPSSAPWPPTTPISERRGLVADQLEQLALAEVRAEQAACAHRVDPEQRLRQPEAPHHAARRRARAEHVDAARIHPVGDRGADGLERDLIRRRRALLGRLHPERGRRARARRRRVASRSCPHATASSSMSTTSASRTAPRGSEARKDATTSPALSGVVANTPECILTPVGTPSIGRRSPTTSWMSRAVPSPPAKRIRSTSRRASSAAAARVSSAVVVARAPVARQTSVSNAWPPRASPPITPAAATTCRPASRRRSSRASARCGTLGGDGTAPSAVRAFERVGTVRSLQPDAAAHAAIGLTISPRRAIGSGLAPQLCRDVVDGLPGDPDELADLVLGDHERRRERDRVGAGSARVIRPSSRQRRVTRAPTLSAGSKRSAGSLRATNSSPAINAVPAPRRRAGDRQTPRGAARSSARRARRPGDEPFALDHVEVRHRDRGGERMGEYV